jgi:hypothetical protein
MGELTKLLMPFLTRLDTLPMYVKAGWLVWLASGAVLVEWRRRGRSVPAWLPPVAPRFMRRAEPLALREPIPVYVEPAAEAIAEAKSEPAPKTSKRRRRSRGHSSVTGDRPVALGA